MQSQRECHPANKDPAVGRAVEHDKAHRPEDRHRRQQPLAIAPRQQAGRPGEQPDRGPGDAAQDQVVARRAVLLHSLPPEHKAARHRAPTQRRRAAPAAPTAPSSVPATSRQSRAATRPRPAAGRQLPGAERAAPAAAATPTPAGPKRPVPSALPARPPRFASGPTMSRRPCQAPVEISHLFSCSSSAGRVLKRHAEQEEPASRDMGARRQTSHLPRRTNHSLRGSGSTGTPLFS